jgi:hypothetical protein
MWRFEQKRLPIFSEILACLFVYLCLVYLTTQAVCHAIRISVGEWKIVNNELKRIYNIAVVSTSKLTPRQTSVRIIRSPGQELNPELPEYESQIWDCLV